MKKIFTYIFAIVLSAFCVMSPVYAGDDLEKNCVKTSILGGPDGKVCDNGNGESIKEQIIKTVIVVLSVFVGALGVIGIMITGIQFITSSGDVAKAKKAKRRLIEIIIGMALYACSYGLLQFLSPSFGK